MNPEPNQFLTENMVKTLADEGATDQDICDLHGISHYDLLIRFAPLLVYTRAERRLKIRKLQNAAAEKGRVGILTLLGKHELGQGRKPAADIDDDPEPELEPKVG